jgi:hypothetical protein
MTPQSQNKLLKTLDEPSGGNIILLLTSNSDLLLKTVRSRCLVLRTGASGGAQSGEFTEAAAAFYGRLASGGAYYELSGLVAAAAERDASDGFFDALEVRLRDALVAGAAGARPSVPSRCDILRFVDCVEDARRGVSGGLNVKYALKTMILNMLDVLAAGEERTAPRHGGAWRRYRR